jgi:FtsZ-binding cell division protein ZapB|tara:strand:- start:416 stop:628 length:213 start_codon:yes stop_codon:yes gene_type:complete
MTSTEMITELTQTVETLKKDVNLLKEDNKYLYNKLSKAYDDRIALRAENHRLKNPVIQQLEEEECITCSA